jgi:hypothetical protein
MQINGLLLQNILLIISSQPEFLVGSAPLELQATVPDYMVPFAPILQKGEKPFAMFVDLKNKYDWVLKRVIIYQSVDRLIEVLGDEIVRPPRRSSTNSWRGGPDDSRISRAANQDAPGTARASLDHLVGAGEQRRRHVKTQNLQGFVADPFGRKVGVCTRLPFVARSGLRRSVAR